MTIAVRSSRNRQIIKISFVYSFLSIILLLSSSFSLAVIIFYHQPEFLVNSDKQFNIEFFPLSNLNFKSLSFYPYFRHVLHVAAVYTTQIIYFYRMLRKIHNLLINIYDTKITYNYVSITETLLAYKNLILIFLLFSLVVSLSFDTIHFKNTLARNQYYLRYAPKARWISFKNAIPFSSIAEQISFNFLPNIFSY